MRISELASELDITSAYIIDALAKMGVEGKKTASSAIDPTNAEKIRRVVGNLPSAARKAEHEKTLKGAKKRAPAKEKAPAATLAKPPAAAQAKPPVAAHEPPAVPDAERQAAEAAEKRKKAESDSAARIIEEKKKAEDSARKVIDEKKKSEEAKRRADEDRRRTEEAQRRKADEKKRKEDERRRRKEDDEMRALERQVADEDRKKVEEAAKSVVIEEAMIVKEFAERLNVPVAEVIKRLFMKGTAVTVNQTLGVEVAINLAKEMGYTVKVQEALVLDKIKDIVADTSNLPIRPPVITIMGHVDHGKTSLLDAIRKTKVASGEAGGITQHIGAYSVHYGKGTVTFIDTPGHEAFTALRARGAKVTDIVVLVVAADDGVMPQTVEAINHAKAANVAIIVAVNKIDKPGANPEKVKKDLLNYGLVAEEWGGQTIFIPVSAKTGQGLEQLLEMLGLQAEVLDLRAEPDQMAIATVIESRLDRSRGPVLSLIVNKGTLKLGDIFVAGQFQGRVRALVNDKGENVKEAGPSMPVEMLGAADACPPGELLAVVDSDRKARQISQARQDAARDKKMAVKQHVRLENVLESLHEGEMMDLKLVIKADTQGSSDAVSELLGKLTFDTVKLQVIHSGVGAITETDVMLADASDAIIIGFNIRPTEKAKTLAQREKIDMRLYNIIYEVADDISLAVKGMLKPKIVERTLGRAEVRNTFRVSNVGTIAGSMVRDGLIRRNALCRLIRDNVVIYTGTVSSLKRFKDDAREVASGYECGIGLDGYNDVKVGDIIELFVKEEAAQPANV